MLRSKPFLRFAAPLVWFALTVSARAEPQQLDTIRDVVLWILLETAAAFAG